jgi:hypothetical protein
MSLTVHAYRVNASNSTEWIEEQSGRYTHTAGPESWRTTVYGSQYVRNLGAQLLPRLADMDLYVETPSELDALAAECFLIMANIAEVAAAIDRDPDEVAGRFHNILLAIDRAREHGGHVVIL